MPMAEPGKIRMTVNGQAREGWAEPRRLLVDFLREDLGLTGTHIGCEHGICGACTVMFNGEAARSCLMLAVQADGAELMTVEGLAHDGKLHPLQEAFWEHHGLQCGFCTPGMLMAAYDFLRVNPDPTEQEIREALSAVLCRCTGYQGIVRAVKAAAGRMRTRLGDDMESNRAPGAGGVIQTQGSAVISKFPSGSTSGVTSSIATSSKDAARASPHGPRAARTLSPSFALSPTASPTRCARSAWAEATT